MGKIRRGGFVFVAWKGDHGPRHVHVFRNGRLVAKWDLERGMLMKGRASRRLRALIQELDREDAL
jgi:hypothetical protein